MTYSAFKKTMDTGWRMICRPSILICSNLCGYVQENTIWNASVMICWRRGGFHCCEMVGYFLAIITGPNFEASHWFARTHSDESCQDQLKKGHRNLLMMSQLRYIGVNTWTKSYWVSGRVSGGFARWKRVVEKMRIKTEKMNEYWADLRVRIILKKGT